MSKIYENIYHSTNHRQNNEKIRRKFFSCERFGTLRNSRMERAESWNGRAYGTSEKLIRTSFWPRARSSYGRASGHEQEARTDELLANERIRWYGRASSHERESVLARRSLFRHQSMVIFSSGPSIN
ncbi:hypothetical protein DMN91_000337 [Ooceraea biroi]|uniref:Uncharacterized protein n=1 Tax=Ooceraea biroi TaxID=2015173 RepID=A0A3L8E1D3_OOCBI|nr:hypothetical protein DMN91_000337 [Ooceraea biroi]